MLSRILREPLVHFALTAALFFVVHGLLNRQAGDMPDEIIVTRPRIEQLASLFAKTWQRAPSPEELKGLVDDFVKEEIYYREGRKLGLDVDDTVVRRRMRHTELELDGGLGDGTSFDDGDTWVDPTVGVKGRADLTENVYLTAWGMIGGFGVSSDFAWDVMAGLGYSFNDTFSAVGGYRAMSVDYEKGDFVFDVVQHGPFLGAVLRF